MNRDVIVVGGGVIGCSIALKLAEAGLKVSVIERGSVGCEASRAAAGMLAAQTETTGAGAFFDLCLRSRELYRDFASGLSEISGIDVGYKDEGTLFVVLEGQDLESSTRWISQQARAGLSVRRLTLPEMRAFEPAVTESAAGAVFLPDDHQVDNRLLMDSLAIAIKRKGIELIEGKDVSELVVEGNRVAGVGCGTGRLNARVVIVAAGSWSSTLLKPLGLDIKVIPARGQMIALRAHGVPITRVIHTDKCYVVPRNDGRILVGATVEYVGFEPPADSIAVNSLLAAAVEAVPELRDFETIETWHGFRPDTIDHLPILGATGIEGLFLATGHFRNGILLAPVTADLLTKTICEERDRGELRPFSIDRFKPPPEQKGRQRSED